MENDIDTTGTVVEGEAGLVYTTCPGKHIYYTSSPNYETLTCKEHGASFNKNTTKSDNTVYAWGGNTAGELGMGNKTNLNKATETLFSQGGYATWFSNFATKGYGLASGVTHTAILGGDGYVYSVGQGNLGAMGDGSANSSDTPVRSGAREDSLLIYNDSFRQASNVYPDAKAVDQVTTDLSRVVISAEGRDPSGNVTSAAVTYTLNVSHLMLKEFTGFNMFLPETQLTNLPAGKDNVKVTIMDPSLATAEWTNANTSLTRIFNQYLPIALYPVIGNTFRQPKFKFQIRLRRADCRNYRLCRRHLHCSQNPHHHK